jgi:hypothetical protein
MFLIPLVRTEVAVSAAVATALLALQHTLVAVGMVKAETFLVGLTTILTIGDDVFLAVADVYSAVAIHSVFSL